MLNNYNQIAGVVKGKGTYGISINPSLKCNNPKYSEKPQLISKLIHKSDLKDEYTNIISSDALDLKSIDNEFKYFIYPYEICEDITDFNLSDKASILAYLKRDKPYLANRKNAILSEINKNYINIIMPKGEYDLNKRDISKLNINIFTNGLLNLILGLKILSNNNIIQRDIKPANMLYSNGTFKIIDFGLSITNLEIKYDEFQNSKYRYWPLEYNVLYIVYKLWSGIPSSTEIKLLNDKTPENISNLLKQINSYLNSYPDYVAVKSKKSRDIVDLANIVIKASSAADIQYFYIELEECMKTMDTFALAQSFIEIIITYTSSEEGAKHKDKLNILKDNLKEYTRASHIRRPNLDQLLKMYIQFCKDNSFQLNINEREIVEAFGEEVFESISD